MQTPDGDIKIAMKTIKGQSMSQKKIFHVETSYFFEIS